jgi:5,5'-dehydrodivanillate O-demethylase
MWDILARTDVGFRIDLQDDLDCNWLQIEENAADVTHTVYLHSRAFAELGMEDASGFDAPLTEYGFQPFEYGLVKSWRYRGSDGVALAGWGNLLVFPTMLRIETEMHWRIPINDGRTRVIILALEPDRGGVRTRQLPARKTAEGGYTMTDFYSQDAMAWETQGVLADRTVEILGASDVGIVMFREMLKAAVDAHARGEAIPAQGRESVINLRAWMDGYLPMSAPPDQTPTTRLAPGEIFDDRLRTYQVPTGST